MNIQKKRDQRASAPGASKGRKERAGSGRLLTGARVTGDLVLKKGFTLVELLVVMVIIAMLAALLLPAIRKSRSKAMVDKARAEESNLAGIESIVKGDIGWYIRLCDLGDGTLAVAHLPAAADGTDGGNDLTGTYTLAYTDKTDDSTAVESELTRGTTGWDGPYQVFQEKSVLATDRGSVPTLDTSGTAVSGWGASPAVAYGTPLDPWGHPYLLAYDNRSIAAGDPVDGELVMIIYSAGPDGVLQTGGRATKVGDADANGAVPVDYPSSDDIIYKFR